MPSALGLVAKCKGLLVPEGDFGSDVGGTKPIFFDVGLDKRRMKEALGRCRKLLGDYVTILFGKLPDSMEKMVEDQMEGGRRDWLLWTQLLGLGGRESGGCDLWIQHHGADHPCWYSPCRHTCTIVDGSMMIINDNQ